MTEHTRNQFFLEKYSKICFSIRENDFIAHKHTRKRFHRTLSIRRTNFRVCSACGKMLTDFTCTDMLSIIRENDFIASWAYEEMISSMTEHTRKCLKVEYLGRIEYNFQKSRATGLLTIKIRFLQKKYFKKFHACVPFTFYVSFLFAHESQFKINNLKINIDYLPLLFSVLSLKFSSCKRYIIYRIKSVHCTRNVPSWSYG